ncbi:MAG TPA: response regulator [Candidatus Binatia bacterium]|jgi:DNA-binding NtrC family response regulator|nr:response regulator [Candidatus Binatia bacterium]
MPKILLVEDDNLTRTTLSQFLRANGYEVELAEGGAQALSLLKENKFDLVVSDVVMPNVKGWDLWEHISATAPDTPVLLMTAYAAVQAQSRQAQSRAMPEVILKPLLLTDLLSKIQNILQQKPP